MPTRKSPSCGAVQAPCSHRAHVKGSLDDGKGIDMGNKMTTSSLRPQNCRSSPLPFFWGGDLGTNTSSQVKKNISTPRIDISKIDTIKFGESLLA